MCDGVCQIVGADGWIGLYEFADECELTIASPPEFEGAVFESALRNAVGAANDAVARPEVQFIAFDGTIRPAGRNHLRVFLCGYFRRSAQVDILRIAHFDETGFSVDLQVDHRKRGIADPANGIDREGVHDIFDGLEQIHIGPQEAHCHPDRHRGKDGGFDAGAESVGENGDGAVFVIEPEQIECVAASILAMLDDLAAFHLDKVIGVVAHDRDLLS